jgi:DNA-binding MarR family transcriptional regulator
MFDLEEFLPYRLYQAAEKASQRFRQVYSAGYGITRAEWRVLFNVGLYGPISSQHIIERTSLDKSKVSRAVQRLVVLGWLTREGDSQDRRRHALELTTEGTKVLAALTRQAERHNHQIITQIGAEKAKTLVGLLIEIEALEPHEDEP